MWRLLQSSSCFFLSPHIALWAQCGRPEHEPRLFHVLYLHWKVHTINCINWLRTMAIFIYVLLIFKNIDFLVLRTYIYDFYWFMLFLHVEREGVSETRAFRALVIFLLSACSFGSSPVVEYRTFLPGLVQSRFERSLILVGSPAKGHHWGRAWVL